MTALSELSITQYRTEHRVLISQVLANIGWERRYIDGQLQAIDAFAGDAENCRVFVASLSDHFAGYVSIQFYAWNRLAQIHGLAVDPSLQGRGIASRLVKRAEDFVVTKRGRGVYVDTPVTNTGAREFYLKQGYKQDYVMTAYYDNDLDGVTYLKFLDLSPM
ncbi:MAG: GNAT family N-acetyltransferase [Anaerolineae bacterium]|nr:GNAT family N-acetyltransferase [Anaerolineae bacterium]